MTKERLENARHLIEELREMQEQLQYLPETSDSTRGSMLEHPYIKRTVVVSGVDESRGGQLRRQIEKHSAEVRQEMLAIEAWISSIENAELRRIFRLRYMEGKSWQQVAFALGEHDESYPRRKCKKFLEKRKLPKMPNCKCYN